MLYSIVFNYNGVCEMLLLLTERIRLVDKALGTPRNLTV
jgi:hypothetical protein